MTVIRDQPTQFQYRATLQAMEREQYAISARIQELEAERNALQQRAKWLADTILSLTPLCEAEELEEDVPKLSAVCYNVLANLQRPATAPEIRDLVQQIVDLSGYSNALAVIHTTLHRMPDVNAFKSAGKTYFQLEPPRLTSPEGLG